MSGRKLRVPTALYLEAGMHGAVEEMPEVSICSEVSPVQVSPDEFVLTVTSNAQVNSLRQSRGRSIITMTFGISTLPPENGLVSKPKAKALQLEVATE